MEEYLWFGWERGLICRWEDGGREALSAIAGKPFILTCLMNDRVNKERHRGALILSPSRAK